ncbi:MAG TPA: rRNA pseudouridine synthase [Acholeplasma sp.]|nr:rRNA pseudouridine synthase [Acholeplasma sp.]
MERLNKVLAQSNIASRRKAEELILEGRVKVNGVIVNTLGFKVGKEDLITVDDKIVEQEKKYYFLVNKPSGILSTYTDEKNRPGVETLLTEDLIHLRLYPVDKLDYTAQGALIITNDGDLTKVLTGSKAIIKTFNARVDGIVIKEKVRQLRKGIETKHGFIKPLEVRIIELDKNGKTTLLYFKHSGANKEIGYMTKAMGHPLKKLTRLSYENLHIEGIKRGGYRRLTIHEIKTLYAKKNA